MLSVMYRVTCTGDLSRACRYMLSMIYRVTHTGDLSWVLQVRAVSDVLCYTYLRPVSGLVGASCE